VMSCVVYADPLWKPKLNDLDTWYEASMLCQRYGIDMATVFAVTAWAADLYERGISTRRTPGAAP